MIGKMLKIMRKKKGLTQKQLGKLINLNRQTIGNYETETRQPPFEIIEKIANNCDYEIIFRNTKTKEEYKTKNIERYDL